MTGQKAAIFIKQVENGFIIEDVIRGEVEAIEGEEVYRLHEAIDHYFAPMTAEQKEVAKQAVRDEILASMPEVTPENIAKATDVANEITE